MRTLRRDRGFSLTELLVVFTIIAVSLGILLPAIQFSQRSTRRTQCSNNIKQTMLALHNYQDTFKRFPIGSGNSGSNQWGESWWVGTIPFYGFCCNGEPWNSGVPNSGYNQVDNMALVANIVPDFMRCPSSPLPELTGKAPGQPGNLCLATYAGVAGAGDQILTGPVERQFYESRISRGPNGYSVSGGVLIANKSVRLKDITDGTSNQLAIVEQSDWCRDTKGLNPRACTSSSFYGAYCGTRSPSTPGEPGWGVPTDIAPNITTIRHPVNTKTYSDPRLGINENHGVNAGIQSAHPGGAFAGRGDGSAVFLSEQVAPRILFRLATRDDGAEPTHPSKTTPPPKTTPWVVLGD